MEQKENMQQNNEMNSSSNIAYMNFNMSESDIALGFHNRLKKMENREGADNYYLSLQDKIMWCKNKYPYSYDDYKIIMDSETCMVVEACVYTEYGENGKLIGKAIGSADESQLTEFKSVNSKKAFLLKLAQGSALTRAYTKAGFGLQFRGDSFEVELEELKKDRQKRLEDTILNMDSMNAQNGDIAQEIAPVLEDSVTNPANQEQEKPTDTKSEANTKKSDVKAAVKPRKNVTTIIPPKSPSSVPESTQIDDLADNNCSTDCEKGSENTEIDEVSSNTTSSDNNMSDNQDSEAINVFSSSILTESENVEVAENSSAETSSASVDNVMDDELPFSEESKPSQDNPITSEMTVEEARNVIVDFGNHIKGSTIGYNETNQVRNLKYIYKNGSDLHKKAVSIIAQHNDFVKQMFTEAGIPI